MLDEVVHQQPEDLELVDEAALLVGRARAVGVAVEEQAQVVAALGEHAQRLVDVRADGLRVDATEEGVPLAVDLRHPDPATGEQSRDPASAGAPHRLHEHVEVGRLELVEVQRPPHEALVALEGVEPIDEAGGLRVGERAPRDRLATVSRDARLEHLQDVRSGRRALGRLDLEAVVRPRVVAGGDDDAGRRATLHDLVRGHLRRYRVRRQAPRGCREQAGPLPRPRRSAPRRTAGQTRPRRPWPAGPARRRTPPRRPRSGGPRT